MSDYFGIVRERIFSPGKIEADTAVLEAVADRLRQLGHVVSVFSADAPKWPDADGATAVFTMCQGSEALQRLSVWRARGVRVVNSPQAILNCQRHRTVTLLKDAGVPFPESLVVQTDSRDCLPEWVSGGAWVKRGDVHATEAGDVVRVDSVNAAGAALPAFHRRGISQVVVQQHGPGTVLKFYAVLGSFFHCAPPSGAVRAPPTVLARMRSLGERAARALGVEIYGGDCVYDAQRDALSLIDLNDWPSYASCRVEAATEIAAYLHARDVASGSSSTAVW
jgi:glutathione synthase/RimK-type ligase-like ATP-grasp enzyme